MITNEDALNAMKTLEVFCADHEDCEDCPLSNRFYGCIFQQMVIDANDANCSYAPAFWDIEGYCRQFLDPSFTPDK